MHQGGAGVSSTSLLPGQEDPFDVSDLSPEIKSVEGVLWTVQEVWEPEHLARREGREGREGR